MKKHIVLVEDDEVIRENYTEILQDEGFSVSAFSNRQDAQDYFNRQLPDIAILDISLAEDREGGFQLCSDLRRHSATLPIIFLTSHGSEHDKISGMRLGADDYLTKDISVEYLVVRIQALLRRMQKLSEYNPLTEAPELNHSKQRLYLDKDKLLAYWDGQAVELTLTQYWIVEALMHPAGQAKTFEQLMKAANIYVEPNTISAHIKTIRSRFRAIYPDFDCIKNERGTGYRWIER